MKFFTLECYADPGHSWIKVHKDFINGLIGEQWRKEFTCFSHEKGEFIYIEEDDDASTLRRLLLEKGYVYSLVYHHSNEHSQIRNYPPLQPI